MANTAIRALLDQAEAANADAHARVREVAAMNGTRPVLKRPDGAHFQITLRLAQYIRARRTRPCPHIKPNKPQPMFWIAWNPDRLRCLACYGHANDAIKGTDEDRRCDGCGQIRDTVVPGLIQIPSSVVPALQYVAGPIAVIFGLCRPCQDTTGVEPAPDADG